MKILFVENRYKTAFWEKIGVYLLSQGHEIYWIVQNHSFKPKSGNINLIPYPNSAYKHPKNYTESIKKIISSNRGINYFGIKSDDFVFYYQHQIEQIIEHIKPDVVFGESTLFHELLVIESCKRSSILYLHPTTCRYPINRISFYKYDSLIPFGGSQEVFSLAEATLEIEKIVRREVVPDYMKVIKPKFSRKKVLKDKMKLSIAYFLGERYNTPFPLIKRKLESRKNKLINDWELISAQQIDNIEGLSILYPLQMQPEANIDVWGYPNSNQLSVIKSIHKNLKTGQKLYIKPNPKSKYELNDDLINFIKDNRLNVIALSHSSVMKDVFAKIDMVVTVTGTIGIECILSGKPIVALGDGIARKFASSDNLENIDFLSLALKKNKEDHGVTLMSELIASSYNGQIGDSYLSADILTDQENFKNIKMAFTDILNLVSR